MTKVEFENRVQAAQNETHDALVEMWSNINKGQQNKLLKNAVVVAVLKRYGVVD